MGSEVGAGGLEEPFQHPQGHLQQGSTPVGGDITPWAVSQTLLTAHWLLLFKVGFHRHD